nr:hypothetical protein [Tanacetum cinerariifolium]
MKLRIKETRKKNQKRKKIPSLNKLLMLLLGFLFMVRDNAVRVAVVSDHGGEGVDTTAVVKDAGEEKDNKGDDAVVAKDSQPLESHGSSRNP